MTLGFSRLSIVAPEMDQLGKSRALAQGRIPHRDVGGQAILEDTPGTGSTSKNRISTI